MQNHYNLLYRDGHREMMPPCTSERIGVITWISPAAGSPPQHLDDAATALEHTLDAAEIASLEAPCAPHAIAGHA